MPHFDEALTILRERALHQVTVRQLASRGATLGSGGSVPSPSSAPSAAWPVALGPMGCVSGPAGPKPAGGLRGTAFRSWNRFTKRFGSDSEHCQPGSGRWNAARSKFHDCFVMQRHYDGDPLVAAVDMFGVVAKEVIAERVPVKQKICRCVRIVGKRLEGRTKCSDLTTENLCVLAAAAVNCRNFFVHGNEKGPRYWESRDLIQFFTETLEFIFAVADLVEAGWDPQSWIDSTGVPYAHPFDDYLLDYQAKFKIFRKVSGESKD